MAKIVKFRPEDMALAVATVLQTAIVQLIESRALTLDQAQRIFDAASKRRKNDPRISELIELLSAQMKWDEMAAAIGRARKSPDRGRT